MYLCSLTFSTMFLDLPCNQRPTVEYDIHLYREIYGVHKDINKASHSNLITHWLDFPKICSHKKIEKE